MEFRYKTALQEIRLDSAQHRYLLFKLIEFNIFIICYQQHYFKKHL